MMTHVESLGATEDQLGEVLALVAQELHLLDLGGGLRNHEKSIRRLDNMPNRCGSRITPLIC